MPFAENKIRIYGSNKIRIFPGFWHAVMPQTKNRTKNPEIVAVCDKRHGPTIGTISNVSRKKLHKVKMQNFGSLATNLNPMTIFFLTEHLTHKPHFQSLRAHPNWSLGFLTLTWTYEAVGSSSPKGAEKRLVDCFQENQQQSFRIHLILYI